MTATGLLVDTQNLSDYLGRDVTGDAGADTAVAAASDMVRSLAGQEFTEATETIALDGTNTDALLLPQRPVTSVDSVVLVDSALDETTVTDYWLDGALGLLLRQGAPSSSNGAAYYASWPEGRRNIVVTYTHGYAPADIPADVRMVALAIATRLVIQGAAIQESSGDVSIRYGTNATDFTAGERAILHKYRQIG